VVVGAALLTAAPAPAHATEPSCQDLDIPVSVPLLGHQVMHGRLCAPSGARTVQVLVPGATYNSSYWDIGLTPEIRSYRLAMNRAGYATFAVDRLGTGGSSRPFGALLTSTGQAHAVHQVIQALRSGSGGPRFDKVILGGHSQGSATAILEAGAYHDADAVLITGLTHHPDPVNALVIAGSLIPAPQDPVLSRRGLDASYLTTRIGTRYAAFFKPAPPDPEVDAYDESTKDVIAVGEVPDGALGVLLPYSRKIAVPVMLVVGDHDGPFCGRPLGTDCSSAEALFRSEAPYYSPAAKLHTFVLPGYGHSINYAPNAPDYFRAVAQWADRVTGR
jgi:pimeloyl-ACP methyl ester carboxylesterase